MAEEVQTHASATFGISSLLLIITLISICLGLFVAAPGLGIVVALVSLAPLIRTVMVVNRRKVLGKAIDSGEKASLFLGSLGVTLIIIGVTMAACCAAFVGSCFGVLAVFGLGRQPDPAMQNLLMILLWGMPIAAGCVSLWLFSYWIRKRWWRDTRP